MKLSHKKWLTYGILTVAALIHGQYVKAEEDNVFVIESCSIEMGNKSNTEYTACFIGKNKEKIYAFGCVSSSYDSSWGSAINARIGDGFILGKDENQPTDIKSIIVNRSNAITEPPCITKKFMDSDTAYLTEGK